MLRNCHPPPPNNNPGRNGNDFGTHGNNWNAFSNPTDSLNAKNIKQEHTFYGNTDDQMLNDRTGMNTSLQETAESKVVDDGIEKYASKGMEEATILKANSAEHYRVLINMAVMKYSKELQPHKTSRISRHFRHLLLLLKIKH